MRDDPLPGAVGAKPPTFAPVVPEAPVASGHGIATERRYDLQHLRDRAPDPGPLDGTATGELMPGREALVRVADDKGKKRVTTWMFEPGHTEAEFRARHMMVTWVRGLFKDIHGEIEFDLDDCMSTTFHGEIDATKLWTGEPERDAHLRSADFFDVETHPRIAFNGRFTERTGDIHFKALTDLTIRGVTRPVELDVGYLGEWTSPFWVGDENKGSMRRIGFEASGRVNRHDFGVSWQGSRRSQPEHELVHIAPAPVLRRLGRADDRMSTGLVVRGRVTPGRVVATA
jgi:polyisoprenoid-binding protein YceI